MTSLENTKKILLSFDLEEFDIPLEYGQNISVEEQFDVARDGLYAVLGLLEKLDLRATFFTTAAFALRFPDDVKHLAEKHEVASHGCEHGTFKEEDLERSKKILENITGKTVSGFRRAKLQKTNAEALLAAGYRYDSSLNPIYLPGRYHHFHSARRIHRRRELVEIPISATPVIRFPLFWLAFKNFQQSLIRAASYWTLKDDGYLNIFFHPWEFVNLSNYRLPIYIKWCDGVRMQTRLEKYLLWLKNHGEFITMNAFAEQWRQTHIPQNNPKSLV